MAFSVSYIIKAVDKFSPVAKKIARANRKMALSLKKAARSAKQFGQRLDITRKKMRKFGMQGARYARNAALTIGLPFIALSVASIKAASDMEVIYGKFDRTFEGLKGADGYAKRFASEFGTAESTAKRIIGNSGDLLVGIGFGAGTAMGLSDRVARLSADLFAANAEMTDMADAAHRLKSGLLGETEGMKALGITINQGSKEYKRYFKEALRVTRGNQLQAKAYTILRMAEEQSRKSRGAFEKGSDTLKVSIFKMNEELQRSKELIGVELSPAVLEAAGVITEMSKAFNGSDSQTKKSIIGITAAVAVFFVLLAVIALVVAAVGVIGGAFTAVIGLVASLGYLLWRYWDNILGVITKASDYFKTNSTLNVLQEHKMTQASLGTQKTQANVDINLNDPNGIVESAAVKGKGTTVGMNRGNTVNGM